MKKLIAFALFLLSHTAFAEISTPITGMLDNGLHYTILPLHSDKGRIEIRLRVHAGSIDESDTQTGVAHMVEHLVFRASDKHPEGVMTHLHSLGFVRAKHYNAVTTPEHTTYMMTLPAQRGLGDGLSALSQMMFFAKMTESDLDKERHIILEEWRGNQGVAARMDEQRKAVIRAGGRYRTPVIGTEHSIRTIPIDGLRQFYQTWYAPNNMNLLIMGDVEVHDVKSRIDEHFGQMPNKTLPDRTHDYYDVQLSDRLAINELHDDRSGVSQVAYVVRFDESASRGDGDEAYKNRLIDRFALTFITKRLQNELPHLPTGVKSVVARKSDISKNTVALGIFSSVDKESHLVGLEEIFLQIKRLQEFPLTQAEFDGYKKDFQTQLDKAHAHSEERDFAGWVQALSDTVLMGKPYLTQPAIAKRMQTALDTISTDDVNARVHEWLSAKDRIVQYQTPHTTRIRPITQDDVQALMDKARTTPIAPPSTKSPTKLIGLPEATTTAHITDIKMVNDVRMYTLSTGEQVLWLKHPSAGNKTYVKAVNGAGTQANELNAWQSQIATQLMMQNAPHPFSKAEWQLFKKTHQLNLSTKQNSHELTTEMNSDTANLGKLISLYHAQMHRTAITEGLAEVKANLSSELAPNTPHKQQQWIKNQKLSQLLGTPLNLPTPAELDALTEQDLHQQWQTITHSPTTFYVLNDADPAFMGQFVPLFANPNAIHANLQSFTHKANPLPPSNTVKFAHHPEQRADIKLWTRTPHTWQGADAMLVNLLQNIASEKLKTALRDETLGVYRLSFKSTLNIDTTNIESEIHFTTDPNRADEMLALAQKTLTNLPHLITENDVAKAKATFIAQESSRQNDPHTHLNRLVLSHKQDNLAYLTQIQALPTHITLANLKRMASQLYNKDSVQVWVDLPNQ